MKLSLKWTIIGFFMPLVGIYVGSKVINNDEGRGRAIKKGSALSTLTCMLVFMIIGIIFIRKNFV